MKVSGERIITIKLPFGEALRLGIMLTALGSPPLNTPPHIFEPEEAGRARRWGRDLMHYFHQVADRQVARAERG